MKVYRTRVYMVTQFKNYITIRLEMTAKKLHFIRTAFNSRKYDMTYIFMDLKYDNNETHFIK